jgi:2'-5' RNA ligase
VFSVELLPDEAVDRAVREAWAQLIAADLPSSGRNPSPTNRPHITLAVRDRLSIGALEGLADALPFRVELGGVLLFGDASRSVLTRHVVASLALLEFHREVASRLDPPGPRTSTTAPDRWSPHITLARGMDAERISLALQAIEASSVVGEVVGLRVWDAAAKRVTTLR